MDKKNIIILSIIALAIIIVLALIFIVKPFSSESDNYKEQSFKTQVETPDTQSVVEQVPSTKPAETPSKKAKPVETDTDIYIVKEGETLQSIADKLYGDKHKWYKIFVANESEIDWYDTIYVGQKLKVPALKTQ